MTLCRRVQKEGKKTYSQASEQRTYLARAGFTSLFAYEFQCEGHTNIFHTGGTH